MSSKKRLVDVGLGGLVGLGVVVSVALTPAGKGVQRAVRTIGSEPAPLVVQGPRTAQPPAQPVATPNTEPAVQQPMEPIPAQVQVQPPVVPAAPVVPARVAPVQPGADTAGRFTSVRLNVEAAPTPEAAPQPQQQPQSNIAPLADVFLYDAEPVNPPTPTPAPATPTPEPAPVELPQVMQIEQPPVSVVDQTLAAQNAQAAQAAQDWLAERPQVVQTAPYVGYFDQDPPQVQSSSQAGAAFDQSAQAPLPAPQPAPVEVMSATAPPPPTVNSSLPAEVFPPGWPPVTQDPNPTSFYDAPPTDEPAATTPVAPQARREPAQTVGTTAPVTTANSAPVANTTTSTAPVVANVPPSTAPAQQAPARAAAPAPANPAPAQPAPATVQPTAVPAKATPVPTSVPAKPSPTAAKPTATTAPKR